MQQIEEKLRTKENAEFVDWLVNTATENTANMLDEINCPCIKTMILERCSTGELKAYVKMGSMFAQLAQYNIENACPHHSDKSRDEMERADLAFCLSTVEHARVELVRRESEFKN